VVDNSIIIKSECVGLQFWFTDYSKNQENLDLLLGEIEYADFQLHYNLEETTQALMDSIPEKHFLSLDDPPMAGKELVHGLFRPFIPRKKYFFTPLLVIINILVFIATTVLLLRMYKAHPGEDIFEKFYLSMGFSTRPTVLHGQYWRLLTSTFLHFSILHVFFNMFFLIYIGSLIECKLGKWNFLVAYLGTGIIASTISVIWHDNEIAGGASGAIFGILLALLSTDFYERAARKALLISTGIVVVYNIIPIGRGVDHAAHFGGIISGYIFGWIVYFGLKQKNGVIRRLALPLVGTAAVIVLVACTIRFSSNYQTKEYVALSTKVDSLSQDIYHRFYASYNTHEEGLDSIQQKALPEAREMYKIAGRLNKLSLSSDRQKEALVRAKLVLLECQLYHWLYLEYEERDDYRYRGYIQDVTDSVNIIRTAWFRNR
jgi:rhomboid protease GluP